MTCPHGWIKKRREGRASSGSLVLPRTALAPTRATAFSGRDVLELGTSRGRMTAMLAAQGCHVTTVDRGAGVNLGGLDVEVVMDDAVRYLRRCVRTFDLAICDVHGNSSAEWAARADPLMATLAPGGTLLASNASLHEIPEWREETGVRWFVQRLPRGWTVEIDRSAVPGLAIVRRPS